MGDLEGIMRPVSDKTWKTRFFGGSGSTADMKIYLIQHRCDLVGRTSVSWMRKYDGEYKTLSEALAAIGPIIIRENWPLTIKVIPDIGQWGKG